MTKIASELRSKRNLGAVYTPSNLADWVARLLLEIASLPPSAVVCDPACGDGGLLRAILANRKGLNLVGIDLDGSAIRVASKQLGDAATLRKCDALMYPRKSGIRSWTRLVGSKAIDAVIANPPWGADLSTSRREFGPRGYNFAKGQFDSWNLFVEAILHNLSPSGTAALILPDAIFLPEHARMREFLHNTTQLEFVARLGEGFFPEVFRGTTVVVLRKAPPTDNHTVETLRLNKTDRAAILTGKKSLEEVRRNKSHVLPQRRFQCDPFGRWDIDSQAAEEDRIHAFTARSSDWTQCLVSGRGVELSKSGQINICPSCDFARPASAREAISCSNCGYTASTREFDRAKIVTNAPIHPETFPLLVGEDVRRYFASPSRFIRKNVRGIQYKSESVYNRRRLLVRKTGIGIKAAIVDQPCMTNQVVFHYYEQSDKHVPEFYLSYCLGVLASRTLLAYHLRTNGESEWRSHPYITQKVIAGLPIPSPIQGTKGWKQAKAIAANVDIALKKRELTTSLDLRIEGLVAALFGFDATSYGWVEDVLDQAQSLESIQAMRLDSGCHVSPFWID